MKVRLLIMAAATILALSSCTSSKNTSGTRWYHAFNTRYNIYFNGNEAYKEAYRNQMETFTENYSAPLVFHPVSATPKDKKTEGGPFSKPIEKAVKAIRLHSIQTKPERDPGKRNDPNYREFIRRTEYNPFLHNAWMLMARSQFFNGDFLKASSAFSYIARLYESQPDIAIPAKIWKARCYNELGWYYEAEEILSKLNNDQLPAKHSDMLSTAYADYFVKQKRYDEAIPYLKIAIKAEKNKIQRNREKYLLAQIYTATGQRDLAYRTFGEVAGATVPYIIQLNAQIRQTEVYPGGATQKMTKKLKKMSKSVKNKEYLDMVYYALGNVYMSIPDTVHAIESYELGSEKSVRGGIDKAMNQIRLGDIYFDQRQYVKAQPNYAEALPQLKKEDEAWPRVSKRSAALDALVIHAEAVELQDSLQRLSRMTEDERLAVVNKIIEELKKKEKEEREKADQEEYQARRDEIQAQRPAGQRQQKAVPTVSAPSDGSFYFYSQQAVAAGRNAFQQKWGRRKLEDDWRRRNKTKAFDDETETAELAETDLAAVDSLATDSLSLDTPEGLASDTVAVPSEDPHDPQFYLQQIPTTEEEIAESNLILQDGLYNMGVILKEMLEDYPLAIETLDTLNLRFPENENKLNAYHHIYLIYWKLDDMAMANLYKDKIRAEFPESELAIAMADPDYEYNQKMMQQTQDSLYRQAYEAYKDGAATEIRSMFANFTKKYTRSPLMPKFMFLDALSYAMTRDADEFKTRLKALIDRYPNEDVSVLAGEMMKGFQRGLLLAQSGDNMLARGSIFNLRFGAEGDTIANAADLTFSAEQRTPHRMLLLYPAGSVDENLLLFAVANYNFGAFMVNDFDLALTKVGNIGMLQISGFNTQEETLQYYSMITGEGGYAADLDEAVIIVPISVENYETLMKGKSLDEYLQFFAQTFADGNEDIIEKWAFQKEEEKMVEEEVLGESEDIEVEQEVEKTENAVKEEKPEVQPETSNLKPETEKKPEISNIEPEEDTDPFAFAQEKSDQLNETVKSFSNDPIRAFLNLFKRKPKNAIDEYAAQQEKEEKALRKQQQKEQRERARLEAEQQEQQQEALRNQEEADRKLLKEREKQEANLKKLAEKQKKQEIADKKRAAKEREKARKEALKKKKAEQEARRKQKEAERKQKEKERKQSEKARQEAKKKA